MNPLQYSVYKGMGGKNGAVQFNFQPPHFYKVGTKIKDYDGSEAFELNDGRKHLRDGWKEREGAIFLEITCVKDKNVYDWDKKIIMALSITDMGKILMTLLTGDDCKIMHDPGAKTSTAGAVKKFLNISSPNGTKSGCFIMATQSSGDQKRTHKVPLDGSELLVLKTLLTTAISRSLSW